MYPHLNKESRDDILVDTSKSKVLIAYHAHCIDGFTSAWACWKGLIETTDTLSSDITLQAVEYGKLQFLEKAQDYKKIYFVDFSIPMEQLETLSHITEAVILDHHKSALEMYVSENLVDQAAVLDGYNVGNAKVYMDLSECGASLVWKHFFGGRKMPKLIEYVKDYDLWQFKIGFTKHVNKFLRVQPKSLKGWELLANDFENEASLSDIVVAGSSISAYHNQIVADLVLQAEACEIQGEQGLVVNCPQVFKDDVGEALAKLSGTYGATWQQEPKGVVKWSLRSDYKVFNTLPIAEAFGGGGHEGASGFYLKAPTNDVTKLGITLWNE